MKPRYRILITKTLDVPKNVLTEVYDTEESAVKAAKEKVVELDADVAVVMQLLAGSTNVIHTFEKARKAS
jgi:hypothetical protein